VDWGTDRDVLWARRNAARTLRRRFGVTFRRRMKSSCAALVSGRAVRSVPLNESWISRISSSRSFIDISGSHIISRTSTTAGVVFAAAKGRPRTRSACPAQNLLIDLGHPVRFATLTCLPVRGGDKCSCQSRVDLLPGQGDATEP